MGETATQCAWCRRFYDDAGFVEVILAATDVVNHGICYLCLDAALQQEVERLIAEGESGEARAAEENRHATAARLARRRDEALRRRAGLSAHLEQVTAALVVKAEEHVRTNHQATSPDHFSSPAVTGGLTRSRGRGGSNLTPGRLSGPPSQRGKGEP